MRTLRSSMGAVGAGLAAVAITVTACQSASAATPNYSTTSDAVQAAAGWVAGQFVDSSHLPAPAGDHFDSKYGSAYYPNYGENADVIFGLAAAKAGSTKVTTALNYLATNLDAYTDITNSDTFGPYDGAVAKTALAALVAGSNPHLVRRKEPAADAQDRRVRDGGDHLHARVGGQHLRQRQ